MAIMRALTLLILGLVLGAGCAQAAELVMFETDGCPWCRRWHQEVGAGYPNSDEGRRAPLRIERTVSGRTAGIELKSPVTLSPTFVLVDKGREVGRIVGYSGAEFFYGLLAGLLQKLDNEAGSAGRSITRDRSSAVIPRYAASRT